MQTLDNKTKFAYLGKPGGVFSKGFERRLKMITKKIDLTNKKILDMGCGAGVWLNKFAEYTNPKNVFGSEYDVEAVTELKTMPNPIPIENIINCPGEDLAFADNFFDIVFHNEVLEHVQDDKKTLSECLRVLKPGGYMVFFTPNRGWPFEQHGVFIGEKYIWGNIPLLPWLPKYFYQKFAYHVRNYSNGDIKRFFRALSNKYPLEIVLHTRIFPGFDGAVRRFGVVGKIIRSFFFLIEKTPLNFFGISHFVILKKVS